LLGFWSRCGSPWVDQVCSGRLLLCVSSVQTSDRGQTRHRSEEIFRPSAAAHEARTAYQPCVR
jgi:hypothetical protein